MAKRWLFRIDFCRRRGISQPVMGMKILILDGCAAEHPTAARQVAWLDEICRERGWSVATLTLRTMTIAPCTGCFGCWLRTPGICVTDDDGREVLRQMMQHDGVVMVTPVTFGGYSSLLKRALDRSIPMISPFFATINGETHHQRRYDCHPRLAMLGVTADDNPEEEQVFRTLAERNAINFHEQRPAVALVRSDATEVDGRAAMQAMFNAAGWA